MKIIKTQSARGRRCRKVVAEGRSTSSIGYSDYMKILCCTGNGAELLMIQFEEKELVDLVAMLSRYVADGRASFEVAEALRKYQPGGELAC